MRPWYRVHWTWLRVLLSGLGNIESRGEERIPRTGGLVVACNHFSFWDPPIVGSRIPRECHFLAKEELFRGLFGAVIRSVNGIPIRRGVADLGGLTRALELLRRGGCLVMFPEGGRMKDARLHRAKPGIGLIVAHARVPVVPVYMAGTHHIRRCIARQERVRIRFGVPLPAAELLDGTDAEPGRATYRLVADRVMDAIAGLRRELLVDGPATDAPGPTERGAPY